MFNYEELYNHATMFEFGNYQIVKYKEWWQVLDLIKDEWLANPWNKESYDFTRYEAIIYAQQLSEDNIR